MPSAKETLDKLHLAAKKRFGQHFMTDETDLCFIAEALDAKKGETVLEIGPGLGALTAALLEKGLHVKAVEKDHSLADHLRSFFKDAPLEVICRDILFVDLSKDLKFSSPAVVAGNIPYNITSPILFWLVAQRALVKRAVLTIQLEVAERVAGTPGHEGWGAVSVSLQAYADVTFLRKIPSSHFYPPPKVDSAVILLDFLSKPRFDEGQAELFHEIVARAFQKRRKTLLNSLENEAKGHGKERLLQAFSASNIDPSRRPETLTVSEWVLLARSMRK